MLTDGTVSIDALGNETKRISFSDIMGVSIGRRAGLLFGLVSGEAGGPLSAIAAKLGIDDVYAGCKDKAAAARDFATRHKLALEEICFIGDDVNDVPAMQICGLAAAPAGAQSAAVAAATVVSHRPGGGGAAREIIESLLAASYSGGPTNVVVHG